MTQPSAAHQFLEEYRATFERFDVAAVAAFFAFPLQVTGDAADVTVVSVPTLEAWLPQIERIVGAYRLLGVASADARSVRIVAVTSRISHASVNWSLLDGDGRLVYDFNASYTLADFGGGLRVTSIVHDESPKLMAALARRQAASRTA
jgi:hypothetical protein